MERPEITSVFFDQIHKNGNSLLITNFEGPLAHTDPENEGSIIPTPIKERLEKLIFLGCKIILISDQPAKETESMLGIAYPVEIWGSSGMERLSPGGSISCSEMDLNHIEGLHLAKQKATKLIEHGRIRTKQASIAVSWEDLSDSEVYRLDQELSSEWEYLDIRFNLKKVCFNNGIGLVARGFDKGTLVKRIIDCNSFCSSCYLGNDLSDEDAFKALWGRGLPVFMNPEYRETAAQIWLSHPGELNDFLDGWTWALQSRSSDCRD